MRRITKSVVLTSALLISLPNAYAAEEATSVAPAAPVATTTSKVESVRSPERNAIIASSGILGAGLGYLASQSLGGVDNSYREIGVTFLGAMAGFGIGSYLGLKFYPVVEAGAQGEVRSAQFAFRLDY